MLKLIDISSHQPTVNWDALRRDGYEGAIVKATGGNTYVNPEYHQQLAGARGVGLVCGHYHYDGEPTVSTGTPEQEAAHFLAHADVQPGDLTAFDAEERATRSIPRYMAWMTLVEKAHGMPPLFYTFQSFVTELGAAPWQPLARYPLWYAWYPNSGQPGNFPAPLAPWQKITLWQWSGGTAVIGIPNPTDSNLFDGDRAALVALGKPGLAPSPGPARVVTPEIDWEGEGDTVASGEYIIVRNAAGEVYQRRRSDGTMGQWVKLTA